MERNIQEATIEAVLFSMGEAVEVSKLAQLIEASVKDTRAIIEDMKEKMNASDRGLTITELGDSYQMCSKPQMYDALIQITKSNSTYALTDTALETLSIIAYKQPVTRADIEKIRGVDCSHSINRLVEIDLVKEIGRLDAPGRPILFGTTQQFLRCFGVKSIEDLPEIGTALREEMREQAEQEVQMKLDI